MELWIITQSVLRHAARERVLMTFLTDTFAAKADVLASGRGGADTGASQP